MPEEITPIANTDPSAFPVCEDCGEPATHMYTWDWGQSGYVCAKHASGHMMNQANLGRQCQLSALMPSAPVSMGRDERISLHAQVLAANEEATEVKARNLELYNANVELGKQIRLAQAQTVQLTAMVQDLKDEVDQLTKEKMVALKDLAQSNTELARLQGILQAESVTPG